VRWSDRFLILVAGSYGILTLAAANPADVVHPERLIVLVAVWSSLGLLSAELGVRFGGRRSTVTYSVMSALVLFTLGGPVSAEIGVALGLALALALTSSMAVLMMRINDHRFVEAIFVGLAVFLMSGPVSALPSVFGGGDSGLVPVEHVDASLESKPDVFLIVVDGYPGIQALEMDYGADHLDFFDELEDMGFEVPPSAWTPYWTTTMALPSLFEMGYPVARLGNENGLRRETYRIMAGDNQVVDTFKKAGYRTQMVDSGWRGTTCGPSFEICHGNSFFDLVTYAAVANTVIGPLISDMIGHPFLWSSLVSAEAMQRLAVEASQSDRPDFTFVHLIAPHPPLIFDSGCQIHPGRDERMGSSASEAAFGEQIECVNSMIRRFAAAVEPDAVVVVVADHGTYTRGQEDQLGKWSDEQIIERMNVFMAVKWGGVDCALGDEVVLPNLFRRMFSCLGSTALGDVEPRMYLNPVVRVDDNRVSRLLSARPTHTTNGGMADAHE
jgi:hypothetical protein